MNYLSILRASSFAALIVGISAYLAQTSHHFLAGLLITMPIPFFSLWFIEKHPTHMKEYLKGFSISIILYCMIVLFFCYFIANSNYEKKTLILVSIGIWIFSILLCYHYIKK